jgi:alkanesulfonate monooxygenase
MWPETEDRLAETMRDLSARAASYRREIDFGLRIHMIVRETEAEARAAARRLMSRLDDAAGQEIKHRAQDSRSAGVLRQDALREQADEEGYLEPFIWSGIGRARSGCGSAIVGDPGQVLEKMQRYIQMGVRAFILSGYPHVDECRLFARHVLPHLKRCKLAETQDRVVKHPDTTLTTAPRK